MVCQNRFCVYYENDTCILDRISLDPLGVCESCIYVNISEELLNKARREFLEKFHGDEIDMTE